MNKLLTRDACCASMNLTRIESGAAPARGSGWCDGLPASLSSVPAHAELSLSLNPHPALSR